MTCFDSFNSLPDNTILDLAKLNTSADPNRIVYQIMNLPLGLKTVWGKKGEKAGYLHFLLSPPPAPCLPQSFQKQLESIWLPKNGLVHLRVIGMVLMNTVRDIQINASNKQLGCKEMIEQSNVVTLSIRRQTFGIIKIESICRRQFQCGLRGGGFLIGYKILLEQEKMVNNIVFLFPALFSRGFFSLDPISRHCLGKLFH